MNCIVTAGPTYEPLDGVRRLTNFSTGRLGTLLANFLVEKGHQVTLLIGSTSTYCGEKKAQTIEQFSTTEDLRTHLCLLATSPCDVVFHAAAVSDFQFGRIYEKMSDGTMTEIRGGKLTSRSGRLLAEMVPTPKIIRELRALFPRTCLVGWKYEVDGRLPDAIARSEQQLTECRTTACVANGPGYGQGFGLVRPGQGHVHLTNQQELFAALLELSTRFRS